MIAKLAPWLLAPLLFAQDAPSSRPNVIVVMTDDQGYGELSCHGNPVARTPFLDRLGSESVRLTDFHVAPMCTPTRGQLMTGLDAFRNAAMNVSSGRTLLRPELKTLADVFRAGGYRTGIFGKWHLGDNYPFRPQDRGFDEALWFPSSHINSTPDFWDNDYFDDTYLHGGARRRYEGYCTDVFFREAMDWMGRQDRPFFTYLPLNAPHGPLWVPDRYREAVRQALRERPELTAGLTPGKRDGLISYLAMIANIDENVGRLESFLAERKLRENTIVVFLTDNGSTYGQDYYNAGMRGKKTELWEGGHRVPCFIRWPGKLRARDVGDLTHVQDLLPTLADLAGVGGGPSGLDGVSLAPLLRGERPSLDDRMLVINFSRQPVRDREQGLPRREGAAVLWKQWRFLEDKALYDVKADPHQDRDVAAEHPEVVARLRAHLNAWWEGLKDRVMEPQRMIIGSDAENPMLLTACEWLDVFVDQQRQVRAGEAKTGVWHLAVDRPGRYTFELRRWPKESGLRLDAAVEATKVTDGRLLAGKALPIARAKLRVGGREMSADPDVEGRCVRFTVDLEAGPTELQTWFLDAEERVLCGAYYVDLRRE